MTDYVTLPADETPATLLADAIEALRTSLPGWEPSAAAVEVAILAAVSDEASVLYGLLREGATDWSRDFGAVVEGVVPIEAGPASSATTWTATDTVGHLIGAGTVLVITAAAGNYGVQVVQDYAIPAGQDHLAGVIVQALDDGTGPNAATGPVAADMPPAWLATITLDAPLSGGVDAEADADYDARLARERRRSSRAVVLPADVESVALDIPGIDRCQVVDNYNATTSTAGAANTMSVYPIDASGNNPSPGAITALTAELVARRQLNFVLCIGTPTRTNVAVAITVAVEADADHAVVTAGVQAAIADCLSPATWGLPPLGEDRTWHRRTKAHLYEVAAAASGADGVEYVDALTLNGAATDAALPGMAPLPTLTTCTVTIVVAA